MGIPLTEDHSPGRQDEHARILTAGGHVTGGLAGTLPPILQYFARLCLSASAWCTQHAWKGFL